MIKKSSQVILKQLITWRFYVEITILMDYKGNVIICYQGKAGQYDKKSIVLNFILKHKRPKNNIRNNNFLLLNNINFTSFNQIYDCNYICHL